MGGDIVLTSSQSKAGDPPGVRLLSLVNLDSGASVLVDGDDGETAAIVCTGNSLSRDRAR